MANQTTNDPAKDGQPETDRPGMNRRDLLLATSVAAAAGATLALPGVGLSPALAQSVQQKPNVVFILADNVGYGDLGWYGGGAMRGAPTPRLDQMAREGLRLTQFLVEPACTPSRAALMTGQFPIRHGLSLLASPGGPFHLSGGAYTMGELFKDAGYATALFGKWHLGEVPESLPSAHGFDESMVPAGHFVERRDHGLAHDDEATLSMRPKAP